MVHTKETDSLLSGLIKKIMLYRFVNNLNYQMEIRNIKHLHLSEYTGRSGNWFNRTHRLHEDMRVSTLIKIVTSLNMLSEIRNGKIEPVKMNDVFTEEIYNIASVMIDLSTNGLDYLIQNHDDFQQFLISIKVYYDTLKAKKLLNDKEIEIYDTIYQNLKNKGSEKNE